MASTTVNRAKGNVHFVRYSRGELWYRCDDDFHFIIPIADTGDATFPAKDKGMLYIRWIKAHEKWIAEAKCNTM